MEDNQTMNLMPKTLKEHAVCSIIIIAILYGLYLLSKISFKSFQASILG